MAADIPSVILDQVIDPAWGTLVADSIDEHESRIDTLETWPPYLEARVNSLDSWAKPVGVWRGANSQSCGLGPHLVTFPTTLWGDVNVTYSAGSITVAETGIYIAQIFLNTATGVVNTIEWRHNGSPVVNLTNGASLIWGSTAGTAHSFWAIGTNTGTTITSGHIQLWRIAPT